MQETNNNESKKNIIIILAVVVTLFSLSLFASLTSTLDLLGLFEFDNSTNSSNKGGSYAYVIDGVTISDIKVRLLDCAGYDAISGEELIDFETYIIGVVYAENGGGSYEALKAQAVAARSFSLTRAKEMGGAYGLSLKEENGQWILSMRNCTYDHVFCNPYEGCWSKVPGAQTGNGVPASECTMYSGNNDDYPPINNKSSLSEESDIIKAVEETKGQVLIDKDGNIKSTEYNSTKQNRWNELANNGLDYFEILIDTYGTELSLESPKYIGENIEGSGEATGSYAHPCPEFIKLTSHFGLRCHPTEPGCDQRFHNGIDLAAPEGTNVYAFDGGKVTTAAGGCKVGVKSCNGRAGNYIIIDHGNGMVSKYLHLSKILVKEGQKVSVGQLIGEVGSTGDSSGNHLDFRMTVNGTYVNPEDYYVFEN